MLLLAIGVEGTSIFIAMLMHAIVVVRTHIRPGAFVVEREGDEEVFVGGNPGEGCVLELGDGSLHGRL